MRDQLTDEMLTQAAKQVAVSMKASLPVPEECHHEFPPEFERDMKRLIAHTEQKASYAQISPESRCGLPSCGHQPERLAGR